MDIQTIKQLINDNKIIKFYQCPAWRTLRQQALTRDNNECQECKRQGRVTTIPVRSPGDTRLAPTGRNKKSLHVHHLKEVKDYPELALVITNIETLCQPCHNDVHDRLAKVNESKDKFVSPERW